MMATRAPNGTVDLNKQLANSKIGEKQTINFSEMTRSAERPIEKRDGNILQTLQNLKPMNIIDLA